MPSSEGLPTRRLGRTDIQVSYPALGCGALMGAGNDRDAVKIVHRAIEHGVNYLDTAPLYGVGESERITGLALSGGFREKVTLATKCGDPMPDYVRGEKPYSRQGLLNSVEHSLKLLNTKTIDVLLIHDPYKDELEQAMAPGGLMEGMRELRQQGIVKHLGMAVRENEPIKIFMEEPDCDVVQIVDDYCLCRRFAEDSGVLATALQKDIGVVQAAPMYRGMLYNTGSNAEKNPEVTEMIADMGRWTHSRGYELPDLAVQFPARHPALGTCIMGAQSAAEVDGFVANSKVCVEEAIWQDFETEFAERINDMPLCNHFYYVKPAHGFELWPEMGAYDADHSTFVGEDTAGCIEALRKSMASL